jgi:hypothetical protein
MNTSTQMHDSGGSVESRGGLDEMARKRKEATILRSPKNRENPYKMVRQATFEDNRLTFEDRGVLAYLLVKPDDWEINIADLWRAGDVGRDKIYRIIAHLVKVGYLERVEVRDKGKFIRTQYLLHEEPLPEIQDTVEDEPLPENQEMVEAEPLPENQETAMPEPLPEKPYTEKPYPEKPTHTNKEKNTNHEQSTKDEDTKGENDAPGASPPFDEFVFELCEICYGHKETATLTEKDLGALRSEAKKIRGAGFTVADMRAWMTTLWFKDWKWKKGQQRPTPAVVRSTIAQVRAEPAEAEPVKQYGQYTTKLEPRS